MHIYCVYIQALSYKYRIEKKIQAWVSTSETKVKAENFPTTYFMGILLFMKTNLDFGSVSQVCKMNGIF